MHYRRSWLFGSLSRWCAFGRHFFGDIVWQPAGRDDRQQSDTGQHQERNLKRLQPGSHIDVHHCRFLHRGEIGLLQHLIQLVVADKVDIIQVDLFLDYSSVGITGLFTRLFSRSCSTR